MLSLSLKWSPQHQGRMSAFAHVGSLVGCRICGLHKNKIQQWIRSLNADAFLATNLHMACSRLLLCPILHTKSHRKRHAATSHPPVKVAPTSQDRIHQLRSHPPVKVASTSQGHTHQSGSHPPVKVTPTSQAHTHQSR